VKPTETQKAPWTNPAPRRRGQTIKAIVLTFVLVLVLFSCIAVASTMVTTSHVPDPISTTEAETKFSTPEGVTVSGDYSNVIWIRSLKVERNVLDIMEVDLRIQNFSTEDIQNMSIKMVALKGEKIIATADGFVESINSNQRVTTSMFSADDFPKNQTGITYEIEFE
jgi:hypothetical protein